MAAPDGDANALARKLRMATTPVITRISDGRVLLDPRTVDSREDGQVESALVSALGLAIPTGGAELDDESTGGIAGGGDGAGR